MISEPITKKALSCLQPIKGRLSRERRVTHEVHGPQEAQQGAMSTSEARPRQDPLETCILRDDDVTSGKRKDAERSGDRTEVVCSIGQYYVIYTYI